MRICQLVSPCFPPAWSYMGWRVSLDIILSQAKARLAIQSIQMKLGMRILMISQAGILEMFLELLMQARNGLINSKAWRLEQALLLVRYRTTALISPQRL